MWGDPFFEQRRVFPRFGFGRYFYDPFVDAYDPFDSITDPFDRLSDRFSSLTPFDMVELMQRPSQERLMSGQKKKEAEKKAGATPASEADKKPSDEAKEASEEVPEASRAAPAEDSHEHAKLKECKEEAIPAEASAEHPELERVKEEASAEATGYFYTSSTSFTSGPDGFAHGMRDTFDSRT
jgi:hypothetical protein